MQIQNRKLPLTPAAGRQPRGSYDRRQLAGLLPQGIDLALYQETTLDDQFHPVSRFIGLLFNDAQFGNELRFGAAPTSGAVVSYLEIIHQLGDAGAGLTENNLSNWKSGGYIDWLAEQHRLDRMRVRQEFAMDLVQENNGITSHQAASQIAALNLCDIVDDFDPEILKKALQSDPETYVKLLNAYTRLLNAMPKLSSAEVECELRREGQAQHAAKLEKENEGGKSAGLSDKARREMEDKLNLL